MGFLHKASIVLLPFSKNQAHCITSKYWAQSSQSYTLLSICFHQRFKYLPLKSMWYRSTKLYWMGSTTFYQALPHALSCALYIINTIKQKAENLLCWPSDAELLLRENSCTSSAMELFWCLHLCWRLISIFCTDSFIIMARWLLRRIKWCSSFLLWR